ncbi:MAG: T9SS type A sorting domain-containing protein [bacterium]
MFQILIVLFTLAFAHASFAQPNPDTLWTHTYGGSSRDEANSVQQTTDGGYIAAGYTSSFGAGTSDFYLVKTNSYGEPLWTRTYGGSSRDEANSVQQTTDGGYIVAGYTRSCGAGEADFYLVTTNYPSDTLWTRTYGGSSFDEARSVQQTTDSGYIMAGYTTSFGAGGRDFYLVKTNSFGDTLWTRTYGGSSEDWANSAQQTADGGYIVAGYTYSFGAGYTDFYLVKTNPLGDTLWTRTYEGSYNDRAFSVQQTADGGYIVAGETESFGAGEYDLYVVKTNSQGDMLWTRTYGGSGDDRAESVQQTADGGYIVAGWTLSFGAGTPDSSNFYLVKMDSQGDTLWTRTYGGSSDDWANCVQQTADGGYVVAGYTYSFGAGGRDCHLVKTGPDILGAEPVGINVPSEYILCPNFPNPFNPSTQISYELPKMSPVSLKVFNLLGQEVANLVDEIQAAGIQSVTFDGSQLPSGIYFYRLQAGESVQTKKMVLLK